MLSETVTSSSSTAHRYTTEQQHSLNWPEYVQLKQTDININRFTVDDFYL